MAFFKYKIAADARSSSFLVHIDLSVTFDTVDHTILFHWLHHTTGLTGTAFIFTNQTLYSKIQKTYRFTDFLYNKWNGYICVATSFPTAVKKCK